MNILSDSFELVVGDTETLSRWDDAVILSAAMTYGDMRKRFTVEQLIEENTFFMKFDVKAQIKDGRKTEKTTMDWWKSSKVTNEARMVSLYPSENDRPITDFANEYIKWAHSKMFEPKKVLHADRNLFDFRKLQHAIEITYGNAGGEPWHYHNIIDIVSTLRAWDDSRYGSIDIRKMKNAVYHDPRWDSAVDWLRIQARGEALELITVGEQDA